MVESISNPVGRTTIMTDYLNDEVLKYFFDTDCHKSRIVKKNESSHIYNIKPNCDINNQLYKKELFLVLRKKFNKKFICCVCQEINSCFASTFRSRHCVKCNIEFLRLKKLKQFVNVRKRKNRIKNIDDGTITAKSLAVLFDKQNGKCFYCSCGLVTNYHLDHIMPISKSGLHTLVNVQYLCQPCNNKKYNKVYYVAGK